MQKIQRLILFTLLIVITACEAEKDPYFLVSSEQVGLLSRQSSLTEVRELYTKDSLVQDTIKLAIGVGNGKLKIYEKGGKHLLTVTPARDSTENIEHILIADPRFTTAEGIGLQSSFKDIKNRYNVQKIVTSLNNIVVFLEGSDIYFTIDKKELPAHLRYTKTRPIEMVEIPDDAKVKYLMVGW